MSAPTVPPAATTPKSVSPKVILATAAAIVAPGVLALLGYLQTAGGHDLLQSLPAWAVVLILAIVPGLATFIAGYLKNDPLRVAQPQLSPNAEVEGPEETYVPPTDGPAEFEGGPEQGPVER